jgi:hypothetical protein
VTRHESIFVDRQLKFKADSRSNYMEQSPSWKTSQEVPHLLWNLKHITIFTRVCPWSLSLARCIHVTPSHPLSLRCILILSSHIQLGVLSSLFPSGFTARILYAFVSHACYMFHPSHPPWLDHSDNIWQSVQVMKLLIMQSSPAFCISSLLGPNIEADSRRERKYPRNLSVRVGSM